MATKAVGSGSLRTLKVYCPIVCRRPFTSPVTVKVTSLPTAVGRAMYLPSPRAVRLPPVMLTLILSGAMPEADTLTGFSKPA